MTTTSHLPPAAEVRPSLARLTEVELRKVLDTRAGRWLLIIIALASTAVAAAQVFLGGELAGEYALWLPVHVTPVGYLLPVLAILTVTSEWGARTGLGTFALAPRRQRVLQAKLGAVLLLTVSAFLFAVVMTAAGTALGAAVQGVPATWSVTGWQLTAPCVSLVLSALLGFGLGLLLLNAAAAIVVLFVLPLVATLLFTFSPALADAAPWLDLGTARLALESPAPPAGTRWWQVATASLVWVLLPAALGARRVDRSEIA